MAVEAIAVGIKLDLCCPPLADRVVAHAERVLESARVAGRWSKYKWGVSCQPQKRVEQYRGSLGLNPWRWVCVLIMLLMNMLEFRGICKSTCLVNVCLNSTLKSNYL